MYKAELDEPIRLDALKSYEILDTPSDASFNRLARLIARICEVPMVVLSLVNEEQQWIKVVVGLNLCEADCASAFCAHAIRANELFVVPDVLKDPLFKDNPLVSHKPQIRFYAGIPLVSPNGFAPGALVIMDCVPRTLTATQAQALETLAEQATMQLELRRRIAFETENRRKEKRHAEKVLLEYQQDFRQLADAMPQIVWTARADGTVDYASQAFSDYTYNHSPDLLGQLWINTIHPADVNRCIAAWDKSIQTGSVYSIDLRLEGRDHGIYRWHLVRAIPIRDEIGRIVKWYGTATDTHAFKDTEEQVERLARRLVTTLESITDAFFTLDRTWRFTYLNQEAENLLQRPRADLLGKTIWDEFKDAVGTIFDWQYHRALEEKCTVVFEEFYPPLNKWLEVRAYPSDEGLTVYFRDISESKRHEAELEYRATHDALTRLPNRGLLQDRLLQAITLANREQRVTAVIIVDFGRIQIVNDTIGREAADQMLCQMAGRLQALFHEAGTVARQGGDEFVVVVEQVEGEQHSAELARLIIQAMAIPFAAAGREFYASSSIGIALYPKNGTTTAELLKNADAAMGQAKQLGRNNFQFYTASMNERARIRLELETALREALEHDEFVLHYQPQVDLQTGAVVGVETLIRWRHPELGLIQPDRFIALAEDTGLIVPIGAWVLRTACAQASAWQRTGIGNLRVAVNLSASQFAQPDFACMIASVLNETGLAATMLDLELTESLVMTDVERTISVLNDLRALGVRLSIDDFGTGYSSLSYLKRFPIDVLKIDRSFVNDISHNSNDAAISRTIISMAHTLGIRVIAEGVETDAQCEFLSQNMCDEIQGYLFSAPLPASELDVLLQENRQLPPHLLRLHKPLRTLLLVDDEPNILSALKRLLRRDSYNILSATSGKEGLELLAKHEIDVIVSDQRMPGMTGVDFLRTVKAMHPDTVRIVLSGFTELQSVTDAVNEGAIYKFLTKPWDDNQLREHVAQAFQHKEMVDENRRLTLEVQTANHHLATANRQLEEVLEQKQEQITRGKISLDIVREALQHVPLPIFGLDEDDIVAFVNAAAEELYAGTGSILGGEAAHLMPKLMHAIRTGAEGKKCKIKLNGLLFEAVSRNMGNGTQSRGKLIVLSPCAAE